MGTARTLCPLHNMGRRGMRFRSRSQGTRGALGMEWDWPPSRGWGKIHAHLSSAGPPSVRVSMHHMAGALSRAQGLWSPYFPPNTKVRGLSSLRRVFRVGRVCPPPQVGKLMAAGLHAACQIVRHPSGHTHPQGPAGSVQASIYPIRRAMWWLLPADPHLERLCDGRCGELPDDLCDSLDPLEIPGRARAAGGLPHQ
jgi:hypothetical protein